MAKQGDNKDKELKDGDNPGGDNQATNTPEVKETPKETSEAKEVKGEEKKPELAPEEPKKIKVQLTDTGTAFDNDVIKIKFHEIVEVEETDEIRKYISKRRLKVVE